MSIAVLITHCDDVSLSMGSALELDGSNGVKGCPAAGGRQPECMRFLASDGRKAEVQ